jgi:hypothetical protein
MDADGNLGKHVSPPFNGAEGGIPTPEMATEGCWRKSGGPVALAFQGQTGSLRAKKIK